MTLLEYTIRTVSTFFADKTLLTIPSCLDLKMKNKQKFNLHNTKYEKMYTSNFSSFIGVVVDTTDKHWFANNTANLRKKLKRSYWGPGDTDLWKKTSSAKSHVRLPFNLKHFCVSRAGTATAVFQPFREQGREGRAGGFCGRAGITVLRYQCKHHSEMTIETIERREFSRVLSYSRCSFREAIFFKTFFDVKGTQEWEFFCSDFGICTFS